MSQYALPTADIDQGANWSEGAGDADGNHFDELDEGFGAGRGSGSGPDDATSYWVLDPAASLVCPRDYLSEDTNNLTDPGVDTSHIMRARNRKDAANGRQVDVRIGVRKNGGCAGIAIATQVFAGIDNVWTTRVINLSEAQAANIDYSDIELLTAGVEVGGGSPKLLWESAHEFECPDAAPPVGADEMMAAIGQQTGGGGGSGDIMAHSRKPPEVVAY